MKKFYTVLALIFLLVMGFSSSVYAATKVEIISAEQKATGSVIVECSISEPNEVQSITVVSCKEGQDIYSGEAIYIDQLTPTIEDNKFRFEFIPAKWTDKAAAYVVKVGGYGIDLSDSKVIAFYDGELYLVGDVNGDKVVDRVDAALILKHISEISELKADMIDVADYNKDGKVDFADVIAVINKQP